ncbi:MAG: HAD family phosphatase [Lachnospiraceae bacterium]|nr:HAD family phosphatase [Lachnospiraceae bacterium]
MEKNKVVFFDLDGVLIDTEPLYSRFWIEAMKEAGHTMSREDSLKLRSLDRELARAFLTERYNEGDYDRIRELRKSLMEAYRKDNPIKTKKGAKEIIERLNAAGIDWYIVTASPLSRIKRYSEDTGLYFPEEKLISTKTVERGKPYPDVYLKACETAGVTPEGNFAVEDSPNGVRSAKAAGLTTVFIPDLSRPDEEDLKYCDHVIDELGGLWEIIS